MKNLHLDQNEKVVMYGMTHVVAVDGYSRKIVGFITLPVKKCHSNIRLPLPTTVAKGRAVGSSKS